MAADFFKRAVSHKLSPTIINKSSNFVVVTYWWGRGNLNKNTQRPCPEDVKDGKIDIPPIPYEKMIEQWENSCKKHNCNYLAEEYAEFAVKGGYQHAINFKPYFIELALDACYPRGVLYIDGDMHIKLYPAICDTTDVDYMARGWNTDPRPGTWRTTGNFCFDPYIFEMSGGTMFFGNTYHGRYLLDMWQKETKKHPGKADDRILSMSFMLNSLLVQLSVIQLPIEYLWLDMDFDYTLDKGDDYNPEDIVISHPECLTTEDRAAEEGASSDRYPKNYDKNVTDLMMCDWETIFEYIHFDNKKSIGPFRTYFDWLENKGAVDIVAFKDKYGRKHNKIAEENEKLIKNTIQLPVRDKLVFLSYRDINTVSHHRLDKAKDSHLLMATILGYLERGQHVIFVPKSTRTMRSVIARAVEDELDFVARNLSKTHTKSIPKYYLELDQEYPMFFAHDSTVLKHLVRMSDSLETFQRVFNSSYIFLTRIHCGWI